MRICVDTSVLLDILKDEYVEYQEKVYQALADGEHLIIPAVVYAELLPQFGGNRRLLRSFLKDHRIEIEPLDIVSVEQAASRWMRYLKRKSRPRCPNCGKPLPQKEHFLSDFYIGGFALARCDTILTRDRGIYRTYFKDLKKY